MEEFSRHLLPSGHPNTEPVLEFDLSPWTPAFDASQSIPALSIMMTCVRKFRHRCPVGYQRMGALNRLVGDNCPSIQDLGVFGLFELLPHREENHMPTSRCASESSLSQMDPVSACFFWPRNQFKSLDASLQRNLNLILADSLRHFCFRSEKAASTWSLLCTASVSIEV